MEYRPRKCQINQNQAPGPEHIGQIKWNDVSSAHGPKKSQELQARYDRQQKKPTATDISRHPVVRPCRANAGGERRAGNRDSAFSRHHAHAMLRISVPEWTQSVFMHGQAPIRYNR